MFFKKVLKDLVLYKIIMEKIISTYNMKENTLSKLSKSQLINLLINQSTKIEKLSSKIKKLSSIINSKNNYENITEPPIEFRDDYKPIPAPRKSVKQMVQNYEENIISPPLEFRDDYKPVPLPRTKKPVPLPRTRIEEVANALKGYTKSYEISIKNNKDPLTQLQNTRKAVEHYIISLLTSMKGLKFVETLKVTFKKSANNETLYKTAYFNSKPQTIINNTEIPEALQLTKQQILNIIAQWISEGSG